MVFRGDESADRGAEHEGSLFAPQRVRGEALAEVGSLLPGLTLTALGCGLMLGWLAALAPGAWGLLLVLGALPLGGGLVAIGRRRGVRPLQRLVRRAERIARVQQSTTLKPLPTDQPGEVGRLARAIHTIAVAAIRDRHEANHLRRTLEDRVAQATRRQTSQLQRLAKRDALTELGNRWYLDQHLPAMVEQCRRAGTPLVCLMVDLDGFKGVNDTLGHAAGDRLLTFVGKLIGASVRESDVAVRLGGDEFAVLMPGATLERGYELAGSLRQLFRRHMQTAHPETPEADMSVGIALLNEEGVADGDTLLSKADRRLDRAKQAGKARRAGPAEEAADERVAG
jgi:diguanylate cyclase (GGDEF)-like protein